MKIISDAIKPNTVAVSQGRYNCSGMSVNIYKIAWVVLYWEGKIEESLVSDTRLVWVNSAVGYVNETCVI